jgi:hypothetical protein
MRSESERSSDPIVAPVHGSWKMQRDSLVSGAAVIVLGAVLTAAPAGLVRSQPAPPAPVPAAAPAPAAAVSAPVQPAAPTVLRDDQVQLLIKTLDEVQTQGFRSGEFTPP